MCHVARHKSLGYFIQLLLKIKYIEFKYGPKILIKKSVECERFLMRRLTKKSFLTKNGKDEHWKTFCESCKQPVRSNAFDFKMCCLYVVLDLTGSVETQLE